MSFLHRHPQGQCFIQYPILAERDEDDLGWMPVLHSELPAAAAAEADQAVEEASAASPVDSQAEVAMAGQHRQGNSEKGWTA